MPMTRGIWRVGKGHGSVVSDEPVNGGPRGCDDVEEYGGYLIAESMSPDNARAVAALPDLIKAIKTMRNFALAGLNGYGERVYDSCCERAVVSVANDALELIGEKVSQVYR